MINKIKFSDRYFKSQLMSEINITPFVDVLLVLLIIFMVAAPMLTGSIDVDLPKGAQASSAKQSKTPVSVSIKKDGSIYINRKKVTNYDNISSILIAETKNNLQEKIFIKGDKAVDYGAIMDIIKQINKSGFKKVILVTDISK
jgi:biopolymer transport protein TolR